ncbi:efflux RND transporter periplasmic adaptor subunit [Rhizobium sp. TRM95111]|uniref:efflux RND transporter periplasmic adaptor subunit n=1 Tax=Rhizobium alarense TaxID=2846851 RepID=UPI001F25E61F|nr:efflux RND transporter periplasmic adaptor subunit [Rhizobium alarense]MCF3638797.1 efflux RND transporter periplasmic adaptor subunit [Rhizobium alarense]
MRPDCSSRFALPLLLSLFAPSIAAAQAPTPTVSVAKPVVREVVDNDEFIGRFQAVDEVSVRARVGGYLAEIHFQDGALVKKGDLLFVIDQRPFQTTLNEAEASLEIARSTLTFAESQYQRAEALVKSGSQTLQTLEDRRRELLSAQASVRGAEASLERAKLDLEFTRIVAPLGGRVDRRLLSIGSLVQADQTVLTTIVSENPIDFYFDVDERRLLSYAERAREAGSDLQQGGGGLDVSVRIADFQGSVFTGKLDFAENRVDGETGTMRVRARFDNADGVLQPGLFGRVSISGSAPYQAILIPDEAIGSDLNQRVVYVVAADGSVSTKSVRTGPRLYGYRVIRDGLKGDETVVINGLLRVRPGVTVKPELIELPPENKEEAPPEIAISESLQ